MKKEILHFGEKNKNISYIERECCYGIFEQGNKLLLVYSNLDNLYSIPGGGIEQDELPENALKREFLEESGYTILSSKFIVDVDIYSKNRKGNFIHKLAHIFVVDIDIKSSITPLENWHETKFIEINEARKLLKVDQKSLSIGIDYYFSNKDIF